MSHRLTSPIRQHLAPVIILVAIILLGVSCGTPATSLIAHSATATPTLTVAATFTPPDFTQRPVAPEPAPTLTSLPPSPDVQVQPVGARIDINAQPVTATVDNLITLTGTPTNLGLPQYTLYLEGKPAIIIRYDGEVMYQGFAGTKVDLVSASTGQNEVAFILRATQAGLVTARINVSGEVRLDTNQGPTTGFAWRSVNSPGVTLNITPPSQPQIDLGGVSIRAWDWSPDSQTLALAGDKSVFLINRADPHNRVELQVAAVEQVTAVAFSPNGQWLAVSISSGALQVWNLPQQSLLFALDDDPRVDHFNTLAFSPDSQRLAAGGVNSRVAGSSDGIVRIISLDTHHEATSFELYGWVTQVIFSPDSAQLGVTTSGTCGRGGGGVAVFDAAAAPLPLNSAEAGNAVSQSFSPNGVLLALGVQVGARCIADGGLVQLWDMARQQPVGILPELADGPAVTFAPNGTLLAASDGQSLRLWSVADRQERLRLLPRFGTLGRAAFSPDGRILAYQDGETIQLGKLPVNLTTNPDTSAVTIQPDNAARLTELAQLGKGTIYDFTWLPGIGSRLLVGTSRGLYVYQTDALSETQFIPAGNPVTAIAVSPDGALAAAAQESFIQLWSLADGESRQNLSEHADRVLRLVFSPDGHWLASGSADSTVRLWDVAAGQARHVWPFTPGGQFVFSADARWLAMGGGKWNRQVQVYDLTTGQLTAELDITPDLTGLAFSPDGNMLALLASGEYPTPVLLWDFQTGQTRRLTTDQAISSVSFSLDGATLATGSFDGTLRLWDVTTGQPIRDLGQHVEMLTGLTFSPDGQWLASADKARLKLWNVKAKTLRYDLEQIAVSKLRFSPDSRTLAFQRGGTVGLLDLSSGQRHLLLGHSGLIASLAFDPGGQSLTIGDWSGLIHLWDGSTGQPLRVLDGHAGPVGNLAFNPTIPVLASGGINEDHTAQLWEVNTGQHLDSFSGDAGYSLAGLTFSPDGVTLAGGGLNDVVLRNVTTGAIRRLGGHSQPVLSVAFSPDGRRLASGSFDETVIIWDVVAGQPLHTLPGHSLGAAGVAFGPDGQWLITGDQQDKIRGWSVESGQLLQTVAGRGQDLALSPDGRLLAYKPTIDTIALWDIIGRQELFRHAGERPLAFSPEGRLLVVGAPDGLVALWGVKWAYR